MNILKNFIQELEQSPFASRVITIIIAGFIFYVSSLTFLPGPGGGIGFQALFYHIGIFAALAFFLFIAIPAKNNKTLIFCAFVLAFLYAITDELHQSFVPGRSAGPFDVFIDAVGILIGSVAYLSQK